jgi:predicted nucleic acid-binding protein
MRRESYAADARAPDRRAAGDVCRSPPIACRQTDGRRAIRNWRRATSESAASTAAASSGELNDRDSGFLQAGVAYDTVAGVRIVVDTNVIVASVRSPQGASREILLLIDEGLITPVLSVPLFLEYESVLKRRNVLTAAGINRHDADAILNRVLCRARLQRIDFLWRPVVPDPKDDCILECAVNGRAEAIVTFNRRHFPGVPQQFGIRIESPSQFLMTIGGE